MIFRKIWDYLRFKKQSNADSSSYVKVMHGINRISIYMFLFAIIVMLVKFCK